ncbi:MAG: FG-GAP-like repeat-containing protein [bacterium]
MRNPLSAHVVIAFATLVFFPGVLHAVPSVPPAWFAEGGVSGAEFGWSVSAAGDVNGDAYGDVVIGAPNFENGDGAEGRAVLFLGSQAGLELSPAWNIEGNLFSAIMGHSVSAGDVNGDGFDDVLVGSRFYGTALMPLGRAQLHYGSSSGLSPGPDWIANGEHSYSDFGFSLCATGDVNGDGFADVVVGSPYYGGAEAQEGRVYAYHGSASGLPATPSWIVEGNQQSSAFGISVAAGDVNGDGFDDAIIGASAFDNGQTDEGKTFLYLGSPTGLGAAPAWTAESDQARAAFGISVGSAGDVDGDGYDEIVVGAWEFDNGQLNEGRVSLFYGTPTVPNGSPDWTFESDQAQAYLGMPAAPAGDLNSDGYDDIVVGASSFDVDQLNEGRALVWFGSPSGLGAAPRLTIDGNQASSGFGLGAAGAGDVDDDGFADLIVGAYTASNGQAYEGIAYLFAGAALTATDVPIDGAIGRTPDLLVEGIYPNPARTSATVVYSLRAPSDVRVDLFDIAGRRVGTPYAGSRTAGRHTETIDARDKNGRILPSGVYFVRVQSGARVETARVRFVR